jgi:hypothetical protein
VLAYASDKITNADMESVLTMKRLDRPIILHLREHFVENRQETFKTLLCNHPEMRLQIQFDNKQGLPKCPSKVTIEENEKFFPSFQHIYDFNLYGRYLMYRPEVPLSLWIKVFEKANSKPSVMYEFLRGPAFAARF